MCTDGKPEPVSSRVKVAQHTRNTFVNIKKWFKRNLPQKILELSWILIAVRMAPDQGEEIGSMKDVFDGQVKVISGVGEFTNVVTLIPRDTDLQCKFQLPDSYPDNVPTIIIRSTTLTSDLLLELTSYLQEEAKKIVGSKMMKHLIDACQTWIQEKGVDLKARKDLESEGRKGKKKGKKNVTNKKNKFTDHDEETEKEEKGKDKKASMRTAADVIKRIQWDPELPKECFIIGYIDRFIGVVEQEFTAFSWEDLASVDNFALAIPQHRIQYFKYKDEKVWDKNEKLDNVFGSAGGKLTIDMVIKKYKERESAKLEEVGGATGGAEEEEELTNKLTDSAFFEETELEKIKVSREEANKEPNYFLALRIKEKDVRRKVEEVQTAFHKSLKDDHDVSQYPMNALHLTLLTLRLESEVEVAKCNEILRDTMPRFQTMNAKIQPLSLQGVDHFYERTIFAKVKYTPQFLDLINFIKSILKDGGINVYTDHGFIPHVTLERLSKSKSRNAGVAAFVMQFSDQEFGEIAVDSIELCQMGTVGQGENGFYVCAGEFQVSQ